MECRVAECTTAARVETVAVVMLPYRRSNCGVGIDESTFVVMTRRFVTVMVVAKGGMSAMVRPGRFTVIVPSMFMRCGMRMGCHHELGRQGRNGEHGRQQRCKRHPPCLSRCPNQAH